MADMQTDEKIQPMAPLTPPPKDAFDGVGAGLDSDTIEVALDDDDSIAVEIVGDELPEPVDKEVLEDDDPSIEDIEQELSEEQLKRLNLTKGVRGRLDKLTWQKNEERRQREQAEALQQEAIRYAQMMEARVREMENVLARGEEVMVAEVRSRSKSDLAAAEQEFRLAAESGDPDRMLEAQKRLNRAQVEAYEVERYRPSVRKVAPEGQQATPVQPQYNPAQDPKLTNWMSKNTWFKNDPVKTQEAMAIHRELTEIRGVDPRTDEYYSQLDMRLAQRFPDLNKSTESNVQSGQQNSGKEKPAASAAPNVVAPPSGGTPPGENRHRRGPRTVPLTRTQVALAEALGLTKEQYAKQLLKEQSNG